MHEGTLLTALGLLEAFRTKHEELLKSADYNVFSIEYKTSFGTLLEDLNKALGIVQRHLDIFEKISRWNNISLDEKKKAQEGLNALRAAKSKMVMNLAKPAGSKQVIEAIELIKPVAQQAWPDLRAALLKKVLPIQAQELSKIA